MAETEIRLHLDESVRLTMVRPLRQRGIDVTTPVDAGLLAASDEPHLDFARSQSRVLVTHDSDFLRLHTSGVDHAGILYCHQQKYSARELLQALLLTHSCLSLEEMESRVEWL